MLNSLYRAIGTMPDRAAKGEGFQPRYDERKLDRRSAMSKTHTELKVKKGPRLATSSEATPPKTTVTEEERRQMIAEAAYFHAEHRGFQGNEAERDWLQAEHEIDLLLETKTTSASKKRAH
jgi:hypothetical protein